RANRAKARRSSSPCRWHDGSQAEGQDARRMAGARRRAAAGRGALPGSRRPPSGGPWMARSEANGMTGQRVLVVDDDPDITLLLRMALRREGYDVEAAGNGEEAVGRAQA